MKFKKIQRNTLFSINSGINLMIFHVIGVDIIQTEEIQVSCRG
jgi:hypothetical protein